ncbi:tetratricopeptide repeat protein [Campylobacter aviculae]|uniref:beta-lactamase n=1 Tax=Campylobacter aviculae TaxID=2510190 RepID=A0A4U7BQT0_9BACT|nr:tetratricopeptide repeat protein [Campylobacter aviculae]TKX32660.1 sel1 repeat family protein [Campylobacter aviculae]
MFKIILILILSYNAIFALSDLEKGLQFYEENKFSKAYEIFEKLCEKNSAKSCFSMAYMIENAQGVRKDVNKAYKLYDKACSLGLFEACFNMGVILQNQGYVNESILAFNKACNLGDTRSCNNVALFYENDKDGQMATEFYKKSCDLKDASACYKLGFLYEKGELIRQSKKYSLAFYSKSCTLGFAEACYLLGRYNQLEIKDLQKAKRYFGMACDKKHKEACAAYKELNSKTMEIY